VIVFYSNFVGKYRYYTKKVHGVNHFQSAKNLEQLRLQVERLEKRGQVSSGDAGFALRCRVQAGSEASQHRVPGVPPPQIIDWDMNLGTPF
jgi:hypothetical protein